MSKTPPNQHGLTLVELLATIVILAIIILFIFSILSSSFKTHNNQLSENRALYDETYALKIISKDLRQSNFCTQTGGDILLNKPTKNTYTFSNGQLFRNNKLLLNTPNNPITPIIDDTNNCIGLEISFSESSKIANKTTLYLRGGER